VHKDQLAIILNVRGVKQQVKRGYQNPFLQLARVECRKGTKLEEARSMPQHSPIRMLCINLAGKLE